MDGSCGSGALEKDGSILQHECASRENQSRWPRKVKGLTTEAWSRGEDKSFCFLCGGAFDFGFLRNRISRDEAVAGFDSVAKQRPDRVDAVSPADFLSFFGGPGIVGDGDFPYIFADAAHLRRDLVAELDPPALQTDTAEG